MNIVQKKNIKTDINIININNNSLSTHFIIMLYQNLNNLSKEMIKNIPLRPAYHLIIKYVYKIIFQLP